MTLVIDAGNTETTVGICRGRQVVQRWRLTTDASRTPDEVYLTLRALLATASPADATVRSAAIGSVVPALTGALADAGARITGEKPVIVDARSPLPIRLEVDEPLTVGADRIINTLAASQLHRRDCIVVDLGTATTFDCITADGAFLGGVIAPGVQIAGESLFRRTSKLPATELVPPERVIGKRTDECIRAGVVLGAAESIDGLVRRIKREWPTRRTPLVIGTGGLAPQFADLCSQLDLIEPDLTLVGLAIAHELLGTPSVRSRRRPHK
jgi:type III pantothenate kinase